MDYINQLKQKLANKTRPRTYIEEEEAKNEEKA